MRLFSFPNVVRRAIGNSRESGNPGLQKCIQDWAGRPAWVLIQRQLSGLQTYGFPLSRERGTDANGIGLNTIAPELRPHELRHTHASPMLSQCTHAKIVSERLGYSSIGITIALCSYALPTVRGEAVSHFGAEWRKWNGKVMVNSGGRK